MYYSELMRFAEQGSFRDFVRGVVGDISASEYVQGVQIGFDRYWLEDQLQKRLRTHSASAPPFWGSLTEHSREARLFEHLYFDYDFLSGDDNGYMRPQYWSEYCRVQGYPENARPIFIKFLLRERADQRRSFETDRWGQYPLLYEYRPPCMGTSIVTAFLQTRQFSVGSSIGPANSQEVGTAGGFLEDSCTGNTYLISCSHVVGPAGSEILYHPRGFKGQPTRVGRVLHSTSLTPKQPNQICNSQSGYPASAVDVGIVQLDDGTSFSPDVPGLGNVNLVSPIAVMGQHQPVLLYGSTSGQVTAELGLLTFWCEIIIKGTAYCFNNLFAITPPHPYYLNSALVKGGDSGAWVVARATGLNSWDGMVIGCDGAQAYCCFADYIMNECSTFLQCNPKLV